MRDILSGLTGVLWLSSDSSIFRRWLSVRLRTDLGGTQNNALVIFLSALRANSNFCKNELTNVRSRRTKEALAAKKAQGIPLADIQRGSSAKT
jgi:hypothetical protein